MLISPFKTLKNCGSSSRLVRRRNLPTGVQQGSSAVVQCLSLSAVSSSLMVRNLYMRNFLLLRPTRSWMKKIGPDDVSFTREAVATNKGASTMVASMRFLTALNFKAEFFTASEEDAKHFVDQAQTFLALFQSIQSSAQLNGSDPDVKAVFNSFHFEQQHDRAILTFKTAAEEAARLGGETIPLDLTEGNEGRWGLVQRFKPAHAQAPEEFPAVQPG